MSTQLYSNWLTQAKVKCYLPFALPSRVNLPSQYQPKLAEKMNSLHLDFSLEHHILSKRKELGDTFIPETSKKEEIQSSPTNFRDSNGEKPKENKSKQNNKSMDNLLKDFDGLSLKDTGNIDLNSELKKVFTSFKEASSATPVLFEGETLIGEKQEVFADYHNSDSETQRASLNWESDLSNEPSSTRDINLSREATSNREINLSREIHPNNSSTTTNSRRCLSKEEDEEIIVDDAILSKFLDMGFSAEKAKDALIKFKNNEEMAIDYLLVSV